MSHIVVVGGGKWTHDPPEREPSDADATRARTRRRQPSQPPSPPPSHIDTVTFLTTSSDGGLSERTVVERRVAERFGQVASLFDDVDPSSDDVPLNNVAKKELDVMVAFARHAERDELWKHEADAKKRALLASSFFEALSDVDLFEVIKAADYTRYEDCLQAACARVARLIMGKTPAEVRQRFGIQADEAAADEAALRDENRWVYE